MVAMHQPIEPSHHAHDTAAGALCQDDGSGCCAVCGVAMTTCELCGSVGYHADLCPDSDETIALAIVRSDLTAALDRERLYGQSDALSGCDTELLHAIRTLGLSGRDSLTREEFTRLRDTMRPILARIAGHRSEFGP